VGWLRGVDLNHRPLGYESEPSGYSVLEHVTKYNKTLALDSFHLVSMHTQWYPVFAQSFAQIQTTGDAKPF
jgi:hypothetical protein